MLRNACASESGIMVLKQKTGSRKGAPDRCYHVTTPTASKSPSTTTAWWPMPGQLILPATLALRLGLPQLLRKHLDLGGAPGRANTGDKMMTLVASALAGGDCIDDADVLRAGGTARVLGFTPKAPSTLGTFLRSFRWGHVRSTGPGEPRVAGGSGRPVPDPATHHVTIDLDSTICETYGLAKEGVRHHGSPVRGVYHPLLAVAAGPGDVLMARLREGRANTARGAAHFLRETVGRVRYGGARGHVTVRADSGFYPRRGRRLPPDGCPLSPSPSASAPACGISSRRYPKMPGRRFLTGGRRRRCGRDHLHPVPGRGGRRDGTAHRPAGEAGALFSTGSLRHLQLSRLHHRPGRGDAGTGGRSSPYAEIENAIRDLKYGVGLNHLPSGRFAANAPGWRYR